MAENGNWHWTGKAMTTIVPAIKRYNDTTWLYGLFRIWLYEATGRLIKYCSKLQTIPTTLQKRKFNERGWNKNDNDSQRNMAPIQLDLKSAWMGTGKLCSYAPILCQSFCLHQMRFPSCLPMMLIDTTSIIHGWFMFAKRVTFLFTYQTSTPKPVDGEGEG